MLFNIETDRGEELVGYLVPDSFCATPELCLIGGGRMLWSGPAREPRPALVAAGRHETGLCGFRIGPAEVPGLAGVADAELRDLATGLTLYRRRAGVELAAPRLFRLETRLAPLRRFDQEMEGLFQAWYPRAERMGAETLAQVFLLSGVRSVYVAGRVQLPAHAAQIDRGFATAALLRDPYEELAERLMLLSQGQAAARLLGPRERLVYREALAALDGTAPGSLRELRRRVRRLGAGVAAELSNPLARLLSAREPGALCPPDAVAASLRALAGFDLVATAELPGWFETGAGALLGLGPLPPLVPETDPAVADAADMLAGLGIVEAMLECDLEIYASVSTVVAGLAGGYGSVPGAGAATPATSGAAPAISAW